MMTTIRPLLHRSRLSVLCALACMTAAFAQEAPVPAAEPAASADAESGPAVSGEAPEAAGAPEREEPAYRGAMDELDLGRTEITGNQELPKVLYIVPWQKSDPGDLLGRPVNTLLDEVLAPLDREEFIRQVDYYSDLNVPQDD
jgi:hypothetical protein